MIILVFFNGFTAGRKRKMSPCLLKFFTPCKKRTSFFDSCLFHTYMFKKKPKFNQSHLGNKEGTEEKMENKSDKVSTRSFG